MKKGIVYVFNAGENGDSCRECKMKNNCPYSAELDAPDRKAWLNGFRSEKCKNNEIDLRLIINSGDQ